MRARHLGLIPVLLLVACSSGTRRSSAPAPAAAAAPQSAPITSMAQAPRPMMFRFEIGDELEVDVWQEEELSAALRVLPDGTIQPSLLGSIMMVGRTVDDAREMLRRGYLEYLKEPRVSVRVTAIHSDRVFVLGEVREPQAVTLTGPTTLVQAITQAEGFNEETASKGSVRLIRTGPDGCPQIHCVSVDAILCAKATDPVVQRGDIVFVPARGVTNWNRTLGQALAPFAVALGAAGSTAAIISVTR